MKTAILPLTNSTGFSPLPERTMDETSVRTKHNKPLVEEKINFNEIPY